MQMWLSYESISQVLSDSSVQYTHNNMAYIFKLFLLIY